MENKVATSLKSKFYQRYFDPILNRCKKNVEDILFIVLNNYHQDIKLVTSPFEITVALCNT